MAYATTDQVIEWIRLDTGLTVDATANRVAELTRILNAVDEMIDSFTNRTFESSMVERTFYPQAGERVLFLGDTQSVMSVTEGEDDTAVDTDGWRLGSGTEHTSDRPAKWLERLGGGYWLTPVKVTGTFGFTTVPQSVVQASVMMTARLYQRSKSPTGAVVDMSGGGAHYIRNLDPDITALLSAYCLPTIA